MINNKIELSGIFSEGYGIIPKKLMKANIDKNIKLILAYMLSYTGAGNTCFPAIRTMAKDLQMSSSTIVKYLKDTVSKGYIEKGKLYPNNPLNHANKYTLLFLDVTESKNIDVSSGKSTCTDSDNKVYRQPIQNNNKYNKNKFNNNTSDYEIPVSLNNNEFKKTWDTWLIYRLEIKKKITPTMAIAQLSKLEKLGPDIAVKMIKQSIENGWQGLFPLKENNNNNINYKECKQEAIMRRLHPDGY